MFAKFQSKGGLKGIINHPHTLLHSDNFKKMFNCLKMVMISAMVFVMRSMLIVYFIYKPYINGDINTSYIIKK